jgi:hypothetical protein
MDVLNEHTHQILAFIHGHNHADNLDNSEAFPIVSIACSKCEAVVGNKPEGSVAPEGSITPDRALGCAGQECWDVMLVNPVEDRIRLIRFGAGDDRIVEDGVARWL